ncbi:hypothetical protein GGI20_005139 [Coemansia sp. BCRC 34301]|nr:hypothetical protein GGI20_005139 [Coemansia sp. BCRC 34301]
MTDDYSQNLQQLVELFPDMDREVVDVVLRDSAGALDTAAEVLLNMNDPDYQTDEQELKKQKEIQMDAEYARRLAETEIRSNAGRARSASASAVSRASPLLHTPVVSSMSSSKFRSMLRFGRRSGSNSQSPTPAVCPGPVSAPSAPLQVRNAEALESDFSDAEESTKDEEGLAVVRRREADLIGLLDDSSPDVLASSYVPLSPSRHVVATKPQGETASPRSTSDVDMNNPFAVQFDALAPVDHLPIQAGGEEMSGDTNPFRARRQLGTPPS